MTGATGDLLAIRFAAVENVSDDSDWEQVVLRAAAGRSAHKRRARRPRRSLVIALAAVLLVLIIGGALAATFSDSRFSHWLQGAPGSPASEREQAAFAALNARTFAGFPADTKLRRLFETQLGGTVYRLYGFRSGDELCLRLVASGRANGRALDCVPRRELRQAHAPAEVALADYPIGIARPQAHSRTPGRVDVAASVSFGFVADGVRTVELVSDQAQRARVGANAFLAIRQHPTARSLTRCVYAVSAAGRRVSVPFARAPVGFPPRSAVSGSPVPGPLKAERQLGLGTINWLFEHKPRGQSLAAAHIPILRLVGSHWQPVRFARVLQPDPKNALRIAVSLIGKRGRNICATTFDPAAAASVGGCAFGLLLNPFATSLSGDAGQFVLLSGLASDDVARINLFLADGERWPVALHDNAFATQAPRSQFPINLVAYDRAGHSIGVNPFKQP